MELLHSSFVLVVLFSADAAHPHKVSQGLSCVNDLNNNVSCVWHGSPAAPGADCQISGEKIVWIKGRHKKMIRCCQLKQNGSSPPGCSFVFEKELFTCFKALPYIRMDCDGALVGNLTDYDPCSHIKMHPPGVPNVSSSVNMTNISWSRGRPHSKFLTDLDFEVQIGQKHQAWKDVRTLSTQKQELRIPSQQLKGHCKARVRVKPSNKYKSHWSDWSPTTSWLEVTDGWGTLQDQDNNKIAESFRLSLVTWGVIGSLVLILVVMLVLYRCCSSRRLRQQKPVPNPSKYFHTLYSVHGGNLTKWMNPLSAPESFFTAQPCEHISPVELCESWDVVPSTSPSSTSTSALLHFKSSLSAGSDTSGVVDNSSSTSSSFFSNMGYFMSSSSRSSAQADPSPAYFTYQDDFHNQLNSRALHLHLGPLFNTAPTYESLKREPQSPDSGFGLGRDDEEDMKDVGVKGEDDHQSTPLLILPLHLPSQMCLPSSPLPSPDAPGLTHLSCDSLQVDEPEADAGGSYAAWPSAGAMCRSSSMPVEPVKTGYLTLKELQTTFSNKSI
uniref:interleukin-2 receptor subunit beta n=1 Tax=Semicossyphus pulcher TaxID=241346 RepID=UPI0037E97D50